jgi:hypothetical protein
VLKLELGGGVVNVVGGMGYCFKCASLSGVVQSGRRNDPGVVSRYGDLAPSRTVMTHHDLG